ncbi:hypothetical protein RND71_023352 [Anisodus tanguticus]|uniref:Uncharacterized protein n=1 Tax=Anisodus tanguticus TaxID=243964 RepID=A0AAE1V6W4_9SOLA|nr:hypothetical protein RND71_023352 [Anisodus tanguticus]
MKNVAKCDTWCELQNPVNHRVFERKLRPKPLGRGHVCLGVTHCVAPARRARFAGCGGVAGRILASRAPRARGRPKCGSTSTDVAACGGYDPTLPSLRIGRLRRPNCSLEKRPQRRTGPKSLEGGVGEGESAVVPGPCRTTRRCLRVGLFGNAAQFGR